MRPVLIALLAALVVAPAAVAEPRFRDLGPVVAGPYTDGHRWAAWMPVRGKVTLFDTARGRAWTQPMTPLCRLAAAGGGMLMFICATPDEPENYRRPLLMDLRSGAMWEPPGVDAVYASTAVYASDFAVGWGGVGRHWIRFGIGGNHWHVSRFLDLATGRVVEDPADPHLQPSLDAPGLFVRMCSPLERPRANIENENVDHPFVSVDYERPWALLPDNSSTSWLAHCGRTTKRRVCGEYCAAHLSAGVVTWWTGREVGALMLVTGRRLLWRVDYFGVVHTANRIFAVDAARDGSRQRVLMARLPR